MVESEKVKTACSAVGDSRSNRARIDDAVGKVDQDLKLEKEVGGPEAGRRSIDVAPPRRHLVEGGEAEAT